MSETFQEYSSRLPQGTVKLTLQGVQPGVTTWVYIDLSLLLYLLSHLDLAEFFFQQGEVPLVEQSWTGAGIGAVIALWGACFLMLRDGVTWCSRRSIQLCLKAGTFVLFFATLKRR